MGEGLASLFPHTVGANDSRRLCSLGIRLQCGWVVRAWRTPAVQQGAMCRLAGNSRWAARWAQAEGRTEGFLLGRPGLWLSLHPDFPRRLLGALSVPPPSSLVKWVSHPGSAQDLRGESVGSRSEQVEPRAARAEGRLRCSEARAGAATARWGRGRAPCGAYARRRGSGGGAARGARRSACARTRLCAQGPGATAGTQSGRAAHSTACAPWPRRGPGRSRKRNQSGAPASVPSGPAPPATGGSTLEGACEG